MLRGADKVDVSAYRGDGQEAGVGDLSGLDEEISFWGLFCFGFK